MAKRNTTPQVTEEVEAFEELNEELSTDHTENKAEDLTQVTDISLGNQDFNEDTIYEVQKIFTIIVGNGAVEGEVGKKIKLSKADNGVIKALLADGYLKIIG